MKAHSRVTGPSVRRFAFALILLLVFASYRPAVCLLSMTSHRSNSNDGAPLFPNQNKPRPTRQQSRATIERLAVQRLSNILPSPERRSVATVEARSIAAASSTDRARTLSRQPDYLKPFLPDLPYNHLSPPA